MEELEMNANKSAWGLAVLGLTVLISSSVATAVTKTSPSKAPEEVAQDLMQKELTGMPGKELQMLTVEYAPGGSSPPHYHHAQVFVYVLSGTMRMQVKGSPVVTLQPGQTFYEGIEDEHTVSANASQTQPATILVFMVKDKTAVDTPGMTP
jgi:quercetin dioxygenase-like cupin family protein